MTCRENGCANLNQKQLDNLEQSSIQDNLILLNSRAKKLRNQLGSAIPATHACVVEGLDWVVHDFKNDDRLDLIKGLFMWLAGPYKNKQNWLIANREIIQESKRNLLIQRLIVH